MAKRTRQVTRKGERHDLLDDQRHLQETVLALSKVSSPTRFATGFSSLMGIRTNGKFLCVYHKGLSSGDSNPYIRTIITDDSEGQVIISLISDDVIDRPKWRVKYMNGMLQQYNPQEGVLLKIK